MTSGSDPRIEMVPPTQTNSINTDECSRGSIPVYSSSSSDFKRVRFQINPDLVIFSTDYFDLTDAPEAISQPLTIYFCPSCCMCSLLCCQVYISSNPELLTQNRLFIIIWLQVLKSVIRVIFVRRSNSFSSSILLSFMIPTRAYQRTFKDIFFAFWTSKSNLRKLAWGGVLVIIHHKIILQRRFIRWSYEMVYYYYSFINLGQRVKSWKMFLD